MSAVEKVFHSGETIISEGHFASSLYVICQGKVDVFKHGKQKEQVLVAQLGPGDFFGEMSLLDPEHSIHSATVRAAEDTTVAITDREDFDRYLGKMTPGMKNLLLHLVKKLRDTTEKLAMLHGEIPGKQSRAE
ncbi:MAG: cyclic nucleotide-binding domain-containing protein [Candidatus Glassbacteria bacterium]|nr:cyclic nucleotide-binding domain-containing protein [Candidatus Glassbacteria bacterium]